MTTPEAQARSNIDNLLTAAGWAVQSRDAIDLGASLGVAVREFPLRTGFADYLLFVGRKAAGAIEAKSEGTPLSGIESQSEKYGAGLPPIPPAWRKPLPFLYESTGVETFFTNGLDPEPRSRRTFAFHKPETLYDWVREPSTFRARLRALPPLDPKGLWGAQVAAIASLERSLAEDRPRALIQMATGSGKTFTAVSAIYRLIKFGGARRVLFLVDRGNLAKQTLKEFQQYVTPDDGRKFSELYNVQRLTTNTLDPVSRVCITTIQRLYSMLSGEPQFDEGNEEGSLFESGGALAGLPPKEVRYNPAIPLEYFDVIVTDECHRSIYNLWRQVLEYFDAHLIGLTATPSKQTLGFFYQNLVMEYPRAQAVVDGVNVDGQVYRIRTQITEHGSSVDAGFYVEKRDKLTRRARWQQLDEELEYAPRQLDRDVVAPDQIRTVLRTYRDRLFTDLFPGRHETPKTLIFAKDDSHAEEIVRIAREEFGKGNDFCKKITYRISGASAETLISEFRNSYFPRIAVTVDMIATGTDIKPLEVLIFMRQVRSRVLFEQMIGRGTRVIDPTDLQAVTSDAPRKDRFIIIDAVGVVELPKVDTQTLDRKPSLPFKQVLERVALGAQDDDTLSTLAGRLARLERTLTPSEAYTITAASGGKTLKELATALLDAIDPDVIYAAAGVAPDPATDATDAEASTRLDDTAEVAPALAGLAPATDGAADSADPAPALAAAQAHLIAAAVAPFDSPTLRNTLLQIQGRSEIVIDHVSVDVVLSEGFSADDTLRARRTVESFKTFIAEHQDEILALQIIFSQPRALVPLTYQQVKALAERLSQPPNTLTTEALWRAYAQLEKDKVRGAGGQRVLTDLISLVRHATQLDDELVPYPERVQARYRDWLSAQEAAGRAFTPEQRWWLDKLAENIGVNVTVEPDDLNTNGDFANRGGPFAMARAVGKEWRKVLDELNGALAG